MLSLIFLLVLRFASFWDHIQREENGLLACILNEIPMRIWSIKCCSGPQYLDICLYELAQQACLTACSIEKLCSLSESFFFPWVLCLQREMGYSLMLINENSISECPPYKAVSQLSSWLQKEWQLIAQCLFLVHPLKVLLLWWELVSNCPFISKRASHFPIRSRVQRQDPTVLGSLSVFLGSECRNSRIPSSFGVVDRDCHMLAFFNVLF